MKENLTPALVCLTLCLLCVLFSWGGFIISIITVFVITTFFWLKGTVIGFKLKSAISAIELMLHYLKNEQKMEGDMKAIQLGEKTLIELKREKL